QQATVKRQAPTNHQATPPSAKPPNWLSPKPPSTVGGYPIASGVIEGVCRHLVKDRMERTGMRWLQPSAGSMLFVRSLAVTGLWDEFQSHRQAEQQAEIHPHRSILQEYTPATSLAA
ncbi:hypothetical protein ACFL2H_12270, partial [Planctomycetota bacterium]